MCEEATHGLDAFPVSEDERVRLAGAVRESLERIAGTLVSDADVIVGAEGLLIGGRKFIACAVGDLKLFTSFTGNSLYDPNVLDESGLINRREDIGAVAMRQLGIGTTPGTTSDRSPDR